MNRTDRHRRRPPPAAIRQAVRDYRCTECASATTVEERSGVWLLCVHHDADCVVLADYERREA